MQWRRLGLSAAFAAALVLIVFGFMQAQTDTDGTPQLPAGVERVFPQGGTLVLRQQEVGADLAAGYEGVLQIDGVEIPLDQLTIDPGQNVVSYRPAKGKDIEEFAPGTHKVVAVFWKSADGRERSNTYYWSFQVS